MKVEDRVAELLDRLCDGAVGAGERRMRGQSLAGLLELVANREQVLDRLVVKCLGERLAFSLLRLERVSQEAGAVDGEPPHELVRRPSSSERSTHATPIQARYPAW